MKKPKFSIIVPVYNVEAYLHKCLESLVNQTCKNTEVLLIDDGSTDKCPEICDSYSDKYEFVKTYHKINGGLSDARNYGLERSIGEYIIFVDSDDFIDTRTCETFNEIIESNSGDIDIIAANSRTTGMVNPSDQKFTYIDKKIDGTEFLKIQITNKTMHWTICRNVYKREFILENQLFFRTGVVHEDDHWVPRVFLKAKSVVSTDCTFYNHNIRPDSITQTRKTIKNAEDIISICDDLKEIYKDLEDKELKERLMDRLVQLYLNAAYIGRKADIGKTIDKYFLKENAYSKRNRFRSNLFFINRKLFIAFWYIRSTFLSKKRISSMIRKLKFKFRSKSKDS